MIINCFEETDFDELDRATKGIIIVSQVSINGYPKRPFKNFILLNLEIDLES